MAEREKWHDTRKTRAENDELQNPPKNLTVAWGTGSTSFTEIIVTDKDGDNPKVLRQVVADDGQLAEEQYKKCFFEALHFAQKHKKKKIQWIRFDLNDGNHDLPDNAPFKQPIKDSTKIMVVFGHRFKFY